MKTYNLCLLNEWYIKKHNLENKNEFCTFFDFKISQFLNHQTFEGYIFQSIERQ